MNERIEVKILLTDLYQLKSTIGLLTTMNQNLVALRKRASHLMGELVPKLGQGDSRSRDNILKELAEILNPNDGSDGILDIDNEGGNHAND